MEAYQQRVIDEKRELDAKATRLAEFIKLDTYKQLDAQNRILLIKQRNIMYEYSRLLEQRIALFPTTQE